MIAIPVARIIARSTLFLELADDGTLDPDEAAQMMEFLGPRLPPRSHRQNGRNPLCLRLPA